MVETGQSVLVIEDDVEINELLGEYLNLDGIHPLSAFDGRSGIATCTADHPRAVILDLMLPDIDGYEVCRTLASRRATADIPVIILTCMNQECDSQKAFASGAFLFMNKPFLPDDLLTKLNQAFAWRTTLTTRPPQGIIRLDPAKPSAAFASLREMTAELFIHSTLTDQSITAIWDGYLFLQDWVKRWGQENKRAANLGISYRLLVNCNLAGPGQNADTIEWVVTEPLPALLAQTILKPQTKGEVPPEPASPWHHFLSKLGVTRYEKDSKGGRLTIFRHLSERLAIPLPSAAAEGLSCCSPG